ncbi:MAG: peptide deformylase, partial [Thermoflexales bacterium]|nr:peptide deformylase [Thermoflexales bacterium]
IGDPILRRRAKKVEKITKDTQRLIDDMIETMRAAHGLGLAAPQIGVSERIAIVEVEQDDANPGDSKLHVLINPEVLRVSEETWEHVEGCLSIPGWRGDVVRPVRVTVRATDREGKRFTLDAEGMLARAILHEVDHLDGVLYIDRLVAPDRIWRVDEEALIAAKR